MRFVRISLGFTVEGRHGTRAAKIGNFSLNAASFSDILRCVAVPVCTGIEPTIESSKRLSNDSKTYDLERLTGMWLCNREVNSLESTVSRHPQFLALWQRRNHILTDEGTTSFLPSRLSLPFPPSLFSHPSLFSSLSSSYPVPSLPLLSPSHPFLPPSLSPEAARRFGGALKAYKLPQRAQAKPGHRTAFYSYILASRESHSCA